MVEKALKKKTVKKYSSTILLIIISHFVYSQTSDSAKIKGTILNATERILKIGEHSVSIANDGTFNYSAKIQSCNFLDLSYGDLNWAIYIEPGRTVDFEMKSGDLSSLTYLDDLKLSNNYLKNLSLSKISDELNSFFRNNWQRVYSLKESAFLSIIDSLKQIIIKPLASYQNENKTVSKRFIKLFKADVNFGFNSLILQYPENHKRYTGEVVNLSQNCIDYLNLTPIDDLDLLELQSFKKYCKQSIDYNADVLIANNSEQKHYGLKKMDILFKYIPTVFKNQVLTDYWLSEYLNEHIDNTWLANSEIYIEEFNKTCQTESYKNRIKEKYISSLESEKDHIVKPFKTVNGYKLEAHIFYPDGIRKDEKRAAIVIFHGGGFVIGNASWAFGQARHYASMGMIAIAAPYRLSNFKDITPVEAIEDAKDLMFWLRKNADSLGITDNKIAASGWSVGAQLCATLAVFPDTLLNTKIHCSPNALLLTSPGTGTGGWFTELLNGAKLNPSDYSPIDHVHPGLPPTIILQGRDDTVTPLEGVQLFHDKLVSMGNYCEIWIYDEVGHLFTPTYLDDNGWPRPDKEVQRQANLKADEFLKKFGFTTR